MLNNGHNLLKKSVYSQLSDRPVFISHGTNDEITSPDATERFFNAISVKDKTFKLYPNALHEVHFEPAAKDEFIDTIISWILAKSVISHKL